jgi:hypothetical protein
MKTPDITPAQVAAALGAVLFKLNVSDEQMAVIVGAIATVVPAAWAIADAIIRHGRAGVAAAQHVQAAAEVTAAAATAHLDQGDVPAPALPRATK